MTPLVHQRAGIMTLGLSLALCLWLTGLPVHAGTVTIAVTPATLDAVDTIARSFETWHAGDHVRIAVVSGTELKGAIKTLPVQIVMTDDLALIEWMEARNLASRPPGRPALSLPMAGMAPDTDSAKGILLHALPSPAAPYPIHIFAAKQDQLGHVVAQRFLAFMHTPEAREAMKASGYEPLVDSRLLEPSSPSRPPWSQLPFTK